MSAPNLPTITPLSFEEIIVQAQASSNFKPLWSRLVKTKFYVAVHPNLLPGTTDTSNFCVVPEAINSSSELIRVSEFKDKIVLQDGAEVVRLSGAEIIRQMPDGIGICLCLATRTFEIATARVAWLKKSLEASKEALLKKKNAVATTSPATPSANPIVRSGDTLPPINAISMPLASNEPEAVKAWDFRVSAMPVDGVVEQDQDANVNRVPAFNYHSLELLPEQPAKKNTSSFDANSIKTRHVTHLGLGIELSVPAAWQEIRNEKAIKFVDHSLKMIVELTGKKRDDLNLDSWMAIRAPMIATEMPFLTSTGRSEEIQGRNWKGQIAAKLSEFKGRFNGDEFDSIYQVYSIQTPRRLISICVRINEAHIEEQRAFLKWLIEGIEACKLPAKTDQDADISEYRSTNHITSSSADAPAPLSSSFKGRLGRLRFIVYSMMSILPMVVMAILTPIFFKDIGVPILIASLILFIIMIIRPIILRLHDLNLSGKWCLLVFLGPVIANVAQRPDLLLLGQVITSIGYFLLLILPGSSGDNEYGEACPPNPIWISVLAFCFIALMVIGNLSYYKLTRNKSSMSESKGGSSQTKSGYGFTPANQTFTINFPAMPTEDQSVAAATKGPGVASSHFYQLESNNFHYMVQEITLDKIPPDRSVALDKFSAFFASRVGGQIIDSKKTMLGSYVARAVRVQMPMGYQDFRFLFVGNNLYVLGVQSPKGRENSQEAEDFFDSFQAN